MPTSLSYMKCLDGMAKLTNPISYNNFILDYHQLHLESLPKPQSHIASIIKTLDHIRHKAASWSWKILPVVAKEYTTAAIFLDSTYILLFIAGIENSWVHNKLHDNEDDNAWQKYTMSGCLDIGFLPGYSFIMAIKKASTPVFIRDIKRGEGLSMQFHPAADTPSHRGDVTNTSPGLNQTQNCLKQYWHT